jgi:hypothetical protein
MSGNSRLCKYTISDSSLNISKIKCKLHECGIRDVKVSPCGRNITVCIKDPSCEQLEVINKYFKCGSEFPQIKHEFKNFNFDWSSEESFDF